MIPITKCECEMYWHVIFGFDGSLVLAQYFVPVEKYRTCDPLELIGFENDAHSFYIGSHALY